MEYTTIIRAPRALLVVKLSFTAVHKLDFVGVDMTPPAGAKVSQAMLTSAVNSVYGNVWSQLILSDDVYAQLTPGQHITLSFLLPSVDATQTRTFIFSVKGHYYTMP